jgi:RHS repeat-associated protein
VVSAGGVTYTYNGLGQVITRTENGVTRRFYYNHAIAGSPIMMERDDAPGTTLRYYVWAPDGALLWMIDAAGVHTVSYYHFDRVGTTLALTDQNGVVTDAYAWTPFGELVKRIGTSTQPFTYVGRWGVRADNGLFHMRARWYDPKTATFLTRDPVWPRLTQALELNPYDYAADQPLEFIDSAGRYPRRVEILRDSPGAFNRSDRQLRFADNDGGGAAPFTTESSGDLIVYFQEGDLTNPNRVLPDGEWNDWGTGVVNQASAIICAHLGTQDGSRGSPAKYFVDQIGTSGSGRINTESAFWLNDLLNFRGEQPRPTPATTESPSEKFRKLQEEYDTQNEAEAWRSLSSMKFR